MKRSICYFISVFFFVFLSGPLTAQTATDIIYLKNGSIIKGTITEEVMGEGVKLETKDGNIFVFKMEEIEKITKDPAAIGQTPSEVVYLKNGSIIKGTVIEQVVGEDIKIQTSDGNILVYKMEEVDKITKVQPPPIQQTEINQVETMNQEPGSVALNSTTQSDEEGVKFSVYAGMSSFSMNYKDDQFADSSYTSDSRSGFVIGGYFDFPIWDFLLFQAGIEYSQKGGEVNRNLIEATYNFSYLILPTILKVCIPNTESNFTPFAFVGLSNGLLVSATMKTSIGSEDVKNDWDSWDFAYLLGAGIDYQVSETMALTGQFRYSIGDKNIQKYNLLAVFKPFTTTSGYNIMVGVKFSL